MGPGVVDEAEVEHGRARILQPGDGLAGTGGVAAGIERRLRREDHLELLVTRLPGRRFAGATDHLADLFRRQAERHPTVGQLDGASQRARRTAADPDRHARLDGARLHDEALVRVVRALVGRLTLAQRRAQRPDRVVGPLAAPLELDAEKIELLAQRTDADAEYEPPATHAVEGAVAL